MKKTIVALMLCIVSIGVSAQYSVGEYVQLVKGMMGWYQAQIAMAVTYVDGQEVPTMVLCAINSNDYDIFDDESRILIKFTDDSKITLPRVLNDETHRDYKNEVLSGRLYQHYYTYTSYNVSKEFLTKILQLGITKVRIVKANGDVRDYEIKGEYQKGISEKLKESYIQARKENQKRISNMNDDNF